MGIGTSRCMCTSTSIGMDGSWPSETRGGGWPSETRGGGWPSETATCRRRGERDCAAGAFDMVGGGEPTDCLGEGVADGAAAGGGEMTGCRGGGAAGAGVIGSGETTGCTGGDAAGTTG